MRGKSKASILHDTEINVFKATHDKIQISVQFRMRRELCTELDVTP
jgi:hypothetical protein